MSLPRKPHECGIFLAESKESQCVAYPKHMALGDSVNNSADLWGVGPRFIKVSSRSVRYRRADLMAWIDERTIAHTSQAI